MGIILQIIFGFTLYPILFIMYFVLRNAGKVRNGYCFGVSVKKEWMEEAELQKIQQKYQKELKRLAIVLGVIPLVTFIIPVFSISFMVWMVWMIVVCVGTEIPVFRANAKLKEWKRSKNLDAEKAHAVYTEMKNAGTLRKVNLFIFLPPLVLSAGIALFSVIYFGRKELLLVGIMIVMFALITFLCYGTAVWMDRQKTQVISSDSDVNINYARARKNLWKNLWLWLAWLNTGYTLFALLVFLIDVFAVAWLLGMSIGYSVLSLGLILWFAKKSRALDACYEDRREEFFEDDDDAWIGGILYYNKKDKRTMVTQRIGIGTTMNLATPMGKIWNGIGLAVFVIVIPVCCIWLMLLEFTPIQLSVEENVLVAEQLKVDYKVPLEEIENITIIDERPKWTKLTGTGMENLSKGTFLIHNVGKCEVFLNPQNDIFLQIETAETTYYMSACDDSETMEIYETIMEAKK